MKQIVKLNETQLRKVVAESVKRVMKEGRLRYNFNNDDPTSLQDKRYQYEKILWKIGRSIETLKRMAGNSAHGDNKLDDTIWDFCAYYEKLLDETGLSGFDPTASEMGNNSSIMEGIDTETFVQQHPGWDIIERPNESPIYVDPYGQEYEQDPRMRGFYLRQIRGGRVSCDF